jgi:acyl-CoA synthetase (NDP forming)
MIPNQPHALLEPKAIDLLRAQGIPYPECGVSHSAKEAVQVAERVGYPVVAKVVSPDVLHKSDAGGVAVGLENASQVREAYARVLSTVDTRVPGARILGMLICQQALPGLEVIVGALKDPLFGPTVMFGLGGIFTEVLRDVSFRIAPLDRRDAEEMIEEIKGYPLLAGVRGEKPRDVDALVTLLLQVSQLVMQRPDIEELDLNPVRVYERGIQVLDVRILSTP